jgi:hypothetical protein
VDLDHWIQISGFRSADAGDPKLVDPAPADPVQGIQNLDADQWIQISGCRDPKLVDPDK